MEFTHVYRWKGALHGQRCRIVSSGWRDVLIEFEGGVRHVVSRYAIRRVTT